MHTLFTSIFVLFLIGFGRSEQFNPAFYPDIIWDPDTCLTPSPYDNTTWGAPIQSKMVVTSDGQLHIVWESSRPNPQRPQIYYKRFIPGAGWTEDTCISGDLVQRERVSCPAIACDSQDNLHVVWVQYWGYNIWYKMRNSAGVWDSVSTLISVGSSTMPRGSPSVACTPNGHVHVAWCEGYPIYGMWRVYREKIGDVWGQTFTVDSVDTNYTLGLPAIAGGSDNRVHIVYNIDGMPNGPYYRCRTGTVWDPRERIAFGADSFRLYEPIVMVNPVTSEPHVCWTGYLTPYPGIYHAYKSGGVWQERETVSASIDSITQGSISFTFTNDGTAHAVWFRRGEGNNSPVSIWYNERTPSGVWQTPVQIITTESLSLHSLFITSGANSSNSNHLYLVWSMRDTNLISHVYFKHGVASPPGIRWNRDVVLTGAGTTNLSITGFGRVTYTINRTGFVQLSLYDATGRLIKELFSGRKEKGRYTLDIPKDVNAGIYFIRLEAPGITETEKVILLR